MRILLTGGSSFTGMWFVEALCQAGHEVVATMTAKGPEQYADERAERVRRVEAVAGETVYGCRFGDDRFLELLGSANSWDLLCQHAADVTDYQSPEFDTVRALTRNTNRLRSVLAMLAERGGRVLLTGSVFEGGEGAGSEGIPHFSAYGLSKALTAQVWQFEAGRHGVDLDKFVIPNPFGPYEEPRFTSYLMQCWTRDEVARVRTPEYVRDNIHVSLLARAYARFAEAHGERTGGRHLSPSGYVESQARFAERIANEMRSRLGLTCKLDLAEQTEFHEPRTRIALDPIDGRAHDWSESHAWDEFASYYEERWS